MQKFIGAVRIALGAQYAADHHLSCWKTLAQHVHERDGATLTDVAHRCAKVRLAGALQGILKPLGAAGGVPTRSAAVGFKSHTRLVRRVVF